MNGANGISLLIVSFFDNKFNLPKRITRRENAAPIQKDKIIAEIPEKRPRNHPRPKANFASPKPIHLPEEITQRI